MLTEGRGGTSQPMNDKAVIDEGLTLIVTGHETTASILNWVWYRLSDNATVESRLHAEIDALLNEIPSFNDLPKLIYTKQVIDETLRLYPPVWLFARKAVSEDHIGSYYVAPLTKIISCLASCVVIRNSGRRPRRSGLSASRRRRISHFRWDSGVALANFSRW